MYALLTDDKPKCSFCLLMISIFLVVILVIIVAPVFASSSSTLSVYVVLLNHEIKSLTQHLKP